jgi:FkbH-like protein
MTRPIKCVVWDLDETLWEGTLLESGQVRLRAEIRDVIEALDRRGIVNSLASRNDHAVAWAHVEKLGIAEWFLAPQIGWGAKSDSIKNIADALNLGLDSFVFVDDQPFERDEVHSAHPEVRCLDPGDLSALRAAIDGGEVTPEARRRRELYRVELARRRDEDEFQGPKEAFLASLGMRFTVRAATLDDLTRAKELTERTNQLNATGRAYTLEELRAFARSPEHALLVCSLEDRYGDYGLIGVALLELGNGVWTLKTFLMSCRVMSRGVGAVLLGSIARAARARGAALRAEFRNNGRNRMMYVLFRFAGFKDVDRCEDIQLLECNTNAAGAPPDYLALDIEPQGIFRSTSERLVDATTAGSRTLS